MSKQITAAELAEIVTKMLTTDNSGEVDSYEGFEAFMTSVAQAVCDAVGGEIHNPAEPLDDVWYVGIHGNDSLPEGGGIWAGYDLDGEL